MRKSLITIILALFLAVPLVVSASTIGSGPSYTLAQDQIVEGNLYAAGGQVTILGMVEKDLLVAGGNIVIAGQIVNNAMVAGGTINFTGPVEMDVRVAGGSVNLNNDVGGELLATGGELVIGADSAITGDAYLAGGEVIIDGNIAGQVRIAAQKVKINGQLEGNVTIEAQEIELGSTAVIGGNFNYQSAKEATIDPAAKVLGQVTYKPLAIPARASWGNMLSMLGLGWLLKLASFLVVTLALFFLFQRRTKVFAEQGVNTFWPELLRGLVILIVAPVVIIVLLFSVVGWILAILITFCYLALLAVSLVASTLIVAGLLQKYLYRRKIEEMKWTMVLLAVVLMFVIGLIPIAGWIILLAFWLVALGTISHDGYNLVKEWE